MPARMATVVVSSYAPGGHRPCGAPSSLPETGPASSRSSSGAARRRSPFWLVYSLVTGSLGRSMAGDVDRGDGARRPGARRRQRIRLPDIARLGAVRHGHGARADGTRARRAVARRQRAQGRPCREPAGPRPLTLVAGRAAQASAPPSRRRAAPAGTSRSLGSPRQPAAGVARGPRGGDVPRTARHRRAGSDAAGFGRRCGLGHAACCQTTVPTCRRCRRSWRAVWAEKRSGAHGRPATCSTGRAHWPSPASRWPTPSPTTGQYQAERIRSAS